MDLTDIAQVADRVSDAKLHSLTFGTMGGDPNGFPLEPAMIAKERRNAAPLLRLGCREVESLGFDTSRLVQRHQELPLFGGDGLYTLPART